MASRTSCRSRRDDPRLVISWRILIFCSASLRRLEMESMSWMVLFPLQGCLLKHFKLYITKIGSLSSKSKSELKILQRIYPARTSEGSSGASIEGPESVTCAIDSLTSWNKQSPARPEPRPAAQGDYIFSVPVRPAAGGEWLPRRSERRLKMKAGLRVKVGQLG